MEVKKRDDSIVEFDSSKIVEAILKTMETINKKDNDNDIDIMVAEIIENLLIEDNMHVGDSAKANAINTIVRFVRSRLFKNYILFMNKLYDIKLKVVNNENINKLLRFIVKQIGEIGLKEILRMIIVKLIESMMKRRELCITSFYYIY